jgi:SSS family solute:Na+ symporter
VDIFKKLYPDSPEIKLVRIGKIATGIIVILGMLWIPIMDKIGGGVLYQYLQNVQAYIAPPITAVFVLGILWKRINAQGAIATLFYGLISGTLRIVLELMKDDLDGPLKWYATVNFSHFAIFNFLACVVVCSVVSLSTRKPSEEQIRGLALGTLTPEQKRANRDSYTWTDVIISVVLAAIVIGVLIYFRG